MAGRGSRGRKWGKGKRADAFFFSAGPHAEGPPGGILRKKRPRREIQATGLTRPSEKLHDEMEERFFFSGPGSLARPSNLFVPLGREATLLQKSMAPSGCDVIKQEAPPLPPVRGPTGAAAAWSRSHGGRHGVALAEPRGLPGLPSGTRQRLGQPFSVQAQPRPQVSLSGAQRLPAAAGAPASLRLPARPGALRQGAGGVAAAEASGGLRAGFGGLTSVVTLAKVGLAVSQMFRLALAFGSSLHHPLLLLLLIWSPI